jgi:hypothetical protein
MNREVLNFVQRRIGSIEYIKERILDTLQNFIELDLIHKIFCIRLVFSKLF